MNFNRLLIIVICFVFMSCNATPVDNIVPVESSLFEGLQTFDTVFSLIPQPKTIIAYKSSIDLTSITSIYIQDESLRPVATYLASTLPNSTPKILIGKTKMQHAINILLEPMSNNTEHYKLEIAPDNISITGTTKQAAICGVNTFRQFLSINELSTANNKKLKCVAINDQPDFVWRGFMLDVARHFFTKDEVCSVIDMMAQLKLNKLQLHLTDDQGWRIPIEAYPELIDSGWKRLPDKNDTYCLNIAGYNPNFVFPADRWDGTHYFGKYSKNDLVEMIQYAADRGIDIIPEIDIPGHSTMAIKAHNDFSCVGKGVGWGTEFSYPLCLGNDDVLTYYNHIFDEIIQLFPSKYIHIGADEADATNWVSCPRCQSRISTLNIGTISGLERWFLAQIEKNIRAKGRKMVVWDDALPYVSSTATIMWWRDWIGINTAVGGAIAQGSEAVITNWDIMYFSGNETNNSLYDIYHLNLYPTYGISEGQKNLVVGMQACVFTENIPTINQLNLMIYPRMFALSEKSWYADKTNDALWSTFKPRLKQWLLYLKAHNIPYRATNL
ncbi:MAG: beta-N-acetylhexosaminidase [Paludibacter sp.]